MEVHHTTSHLDTDAFRVTGIAVTSGGKFIELIEWTGSEYENTLHTGGPYYSFNNAAPGDCPDGHEQIDTCWSYDKDCIKNAVVAGHNTGCTYNSVISSTEHGSTTICGDSSGCD